MYTDEIHEGEAQDSTEVEPEAEYKPTVYTTRSELDRVDQPATLEGEGHYRPKEVCGKLGGAAVFQAFGKLADKIRADLVASWVTGKKSTPTAANLSDKRARFDIEGELDKHGTEPRIIAGDVTSTIMYCWMAAIVEILPDGEGAKFVCTGALVKSDLVVTSASCTHR